jgi:hypothetical protein
LPSLSAVPSFFEERLPLPRTILPPRPPPTRPETQQALSRLPAVRARVRCERIRSAGRRATSRPGAIGTPAKDVLHECRKPREATESYTLKQLYNDFLNAKQPMVDSGELTRRSWQNYKETCATRSAPSQHGAHSTALLRQDDRRFWPTHFRTPGATATTSSTNAGATGRM